MIEIAVSKREDLYSSDCLSVCFDSRTEVLLTFLYVSARHLCVQCNVPENCAVPSANNGPDWSEHLPLDDAQWKLLGQQPARQVQHLSIDDVQNLEVCSRV